MASISWKKEPIVTKILVYLALTVATIFAVYPVAWIFGISLRPTDVLHSTSLSIIPDGASINSYIKLFTEYPFLLWMRNSLIVSLVVTLLGVTMASTAGYAFSRYEFRGKNAAMIALIVSQMFPLTMLLLPLFIMLVKLQIYDTFIGLFVAYSATALPFTIWTMKGFYDTIPASLEEAAMIDGCNRFSAFYKVTLPLAKPALVITALFSFMAAWSEYLVAAVIISDRNLYTLPLGLKMFQSNYDTEWGLYAAGSLMISLPVIGLFLILNRWLVSGLTLGGVKG